MSSSFICSDPISAFFFLRSFKTEAHSKQTQLNSTQLKEKDEKQLMKRKDQGVAICVAVVVVAVD